MTSIKGYENYVIFEDGVVINTETGREMKPHIDKATGYYRLSLSKNSKGKKLAIHRLIALAYIPNPDNKPCIDHVNRIRNDNRIENLRWATHLENNQNKSDHKNNTSGIPNVYYSEKRGKWNYRKAVNGVRHWSPDFDTPEEVIEYKNSYEN